MTSALSTLLPIRAQAFGTETVNAVDARALHAFLEVGKVFGAWITERIEAFGFQEHRDFEVFSESGNNPLGGRPTKEYALSLDMAKELAMVERNEKGKAARLYFIECERQAQDPVHRLLTMSRPEVLEIALGLAREKQTLATKVQTQAQAIATLEPKAAFCDKVAASVGDQTIQQVAKVLGAGPLKFFDWLRRTNVIFGQDNMPYQEYLCRGYFRVREGSWTDKEGGEHAFARTYFTGKGVVWIEKRWKESPEDVRQGRAS